MFVIYTLVFLTVLILGSKKNLQRFNKKKQRPHQK